MKARDVMTADVVAVSADTPIQDIARLLLDKHISGVPVLDGAGAAIGMVSEGDLIGRDASERQARQEWWLEQLAEGEPLSRELLDSLRARARTAADVMTTPVVTVGEDTDTRKIAGMFCDLRIKRAPVVRNGRVVGIVSRENLLQALAEQPSPVVPHVKSWLMREPAAAPEHPHQRHAARADDARPSAEDFRRRVTDFESKAKQDRENLRRGAGDEQRRRVADLIEHHISEEDWRKLMHEAQQAAERGEEEFQLLRFPSDLCSDGGRAVNAPEPDWPGTLRGEAAEVYMRWERDLAPQGFHLAARVISFPDGMPGDIGLFLTWR